MSRSSTCRLAAVEAQKDLAFSTAQPWSALHLPIISRRPEMNRWLTLALPALLVGATATPAPATNVTETELLQAATALAQQHDANYATKNSAGMAALYASDGVLVAPSGSIVRGRQALATYYASRFASGARGPCDKSRRSACPRRWRVRPYPVHRHCAGREWQFSRRARQHRRGLSTRRRWMAHAPRRTERAGVGRLIDGSDAPQASRPGATAPEDGCFLIRSRHQTVTA